MPVVTLKISSIKELPSAQQQMYELAVSNVSIEASGEPSVESGCKYIKTRDCISISFPASAPSASETNNSQALLMSFIKALERSSNKLIIRRWKRGACWWNCNINNEKLISFARGCSCVHSDVTHPPEEDHLTTLKMAKAEVDGYRLSRLALKDSDSHVQIAEVLYFSHDERCPTALNIASSSSSYENGERKDRNDFIEPWAVLSYYSDSDATVIRDLNQKPCYHYPTTMIKTRYEFGFDEPHPRHGRVPINESLDYVKLILRDFVYPLQSYFFLNDMDGLERELTSLSWVDSTNSTTQPFQYLDMVSLYSSALNSIRNSTNFNSKDEKTTSMLDMLKKCVTMLQDEWDQLSSSALPAVLCHMDLQPQNLAFSHANKQHDTTNGCTTHDPDACHVAAVMDWEEACYADPRFELILLCRKVLANRVQAEIIWQSYSDKIQSWRYELMTKHRRHVDWMVGPIEPWLKLECVHSLCTLFFQFLDRFGGGRSPWETKTDLLCKIDRERQRLVTMGWTFCDLS